MLRGGYCKAMKRNASIICVGKIKTPHWQSAAQEYLHRLGRSWQIKVITVREARDHDPEERNRREGAFILEALAQAEMSAALTIALDESGDMCSSVDFAKQLRLCWENENKMPCFIIGGAYGLCPTVRGKARRVLSLGAMTFPHELAQVLLLEQLYRADTILRGAPYHH